MVDYLDDSENTVEAEAVLADTISHTNCGGVIKTSRRGLTICTLCGREVSSEGQ